MAIIGQNPTPSRSCTLSRDIPFSHRTATKKKKKTVFKIHLYAMAAEAIKASTESWVGVAHSHTPVSMLNALIPLSTR
jgi:hypothetical protein